MKDRLGKLKEKYACVLFKDHKQNFQDKKHARLKNPSETEIGLVRGEFSKIPDIFCKDI